MFRVLICKFAKKLHRLVFSRNELSQQFIYATETSKVVFLEKQISTTFVAKAQVFFVMICKFVKNNTVLFFSESNGPNHLFIPWIRDQLCF